MPLLEGALERLTGPGYLVSSMYPNSYLVCTLPPNSVPYSVPSYLANLHVPSSCRAGLVFWLRKARRKTPPSDPHANL